MKKLSVLLMMTLVLGLTACGTTEKKEETKQETVETSQEEAEAVEEILTDENTTKIKLANSGIQVNGEDISEDPQADVYKAHDIIFYLEDQGIEYGEGTADDEHSQVEADAHTVVHITKPGTYEVSGTIDAAQIFVDLGEDAKEDPNAVVNLILNNVDITCTVAPAILFYNVYECAEAVDEEVADEQASDEEVVDEEATMDVDTSAAGANIWLADDTTNKIYASYVAKIFESCELNEEGTEVVDSKKLHKYDGAVYSKMSLNVHGDTGILDITAENEGLCSEMHMTICGGNIDIQSGNDGINTNEDNVSVFAMNGGTLDITVTGETGEGDGIDSNGWLIVNGGILNASACASSGDAGIDADQGIYINGGTVTASGNMMSEIAGGDQASISFYCREKMAGEEVYEVKDAEETVIMEVIPANDFTMLVVSADGLTEEGTYSLWQGDTQVAEGMSAAMGVPGMRPEGDMPEDFEGGERREMPEGERPEGMTPPEGFEDGERPEMPEGERPEGMTPPGGFEDGERPEMPEGEKTPEKPKEP